MTLPKRDARIGPTSDTGVDIEVVDRFSARSHRFGVNSWGEIDIELLTFIERYATNLARWDVLVYFGRNPAASDGARSIAKNVGRRARCIIKELDDLVYLGVLNAREQSAGTVYQLAGAPTIRSAVIRMAQFLDAKEPVSR